MRRIGIIGFGEAGSILGAELVRSGREVTSYDVLLDTPDTRAAMLGRIERAGACACSSAREAVTGADLANEGRIVPTGAHYLDAAVMAPVPSQRLAAPMLVSGPRAAESLPALRSLGFNVSLISNRVGVASAVKMCRSVVIKGLEALAVESLFAARRFGAEQEVLGSLAQEGSR